MTDEFTQKGYDDEKNYIVYNRHVTLFTCFGLDQLLRVLVCDTVVFGGFAQSSVVCTSCVV